MSEDTKSVVKQCDKPKLEEYKIDNVSNEVIKKVKEFQKLSNFTLPSNGTKNLSMTKVIRVKRVALVKCLENFKKNSDCPFVIDKINDIITNIEEGIEGSRMTKVETVSNKTNREVKFEFLCVAYRLYEIGSVMAVDYFLATFRYQRNAQLIKVPNGMRTITRNSTQSTCKFCSSNPFMTLLYVLGSRKCTCSTTTEVDTITLFREEYEEMRENQPDFDLLLEAWFIHELINRNNASLKSVKDGEDEKDGKDGEDGIYISY